MNDKTTSEAQAAAGTDQAPKRKRGRPPAGQKTAPDPTRWKKNLIAHGGRVLTYRAKPGANAFLLALEACGEFRDTTSAIDAALREAAERRGLVI